MTKYSDEQFREAAEKALAAFKANGEIDSYKIFINSVEIQVKSRSKKSHWTGHLEFDGEKGFDYFGPYYTPVFSEIAKAILEELQ